MNVNPSAASVAGTARAAARGGEADNQATESARQRSTAENPAGKSTESNAVDAGDQTSDRGGNGQQTLDLFERSDDSQQEGSEESQQGTSDETASPQVPGGVDGSGEHLDFQA